MRNKYIPFESFERHSERKAQCEIFQFLRFFAFMSRVLIRSRNASGTQREVSFENSIYRRSIMYYRWTSGSQRTR